MDSDNETDVPSWRGIPGIIILINIHDINQKKAAEVAHVATCSLIRQHLRAGSSHLVSVVVCGVEEINDANISAFDSKSYIEIFPLTAPSLDDFRNLQNAKITSYKQAKYFKLSDVLWHCSKTFGHCKKQLSTRSVIILSRLDVPPEQTDQKPSLKRVVDLVDSNIEIKLLNISQDEYEMHQFYKNFLSEANKGKEIILPKPIWDSKELEKEMHQQSHRHLAVARLSFEIGEGFAIGVGVYSLLKSSGCGYTKKSDLDRETNEVVTGVTKTVKVAVEDNLNTEPPMDVDDESSENRQVPLLKYELLHYKCFGGERVEFADSEMKTVKNPFGPPMMKLLGFKPASTICKEKWYFKRSYFLFPNESIIVGSTTAFKALHKACLETDVVAICVLCTRVNSQPNIVALSPCLHPLSLDVEIGFDVIRIPYVEHVRNIPNMEDEVPTNISEAHKTVMKDILNAIKFDYTSNMFENPKLQSEYRAIEAIALEEEEIEPFHDTTKPASNNFRDIQNDLFEELFGPFGARAVKKTAPMEAGTSKKPRIESIDEDTLKERIEFGTVNKYTVPQLKEILSFKNVPATTGLKKNDLVELIYENIKY